MTIASFSLGSARRISMRLAVLTHGDADEQRMHFQNEIYQFDWNRLLKLRLKRKFSSIAHNTGVVHATTTRAATGYKWKIETEERLVEQWLHFQFRKEFFSLVAKFIYRTKAIDYHGWYTKCHPNKNWFHSQRWIRCSHRASRGR